MPRPRPLVPTLAFVVLVSGCGLLPGDSDGTPRERFREAVDEVRAAVEAEVERALEEAERTR